MNTEQIELLTTFRDETKAERVKLEKRWNKLDMKLQALRRREAKCAAALREVQPDLAPA